MSLEEYGDQVKAEAIEREERSQRDANSTDSAARNGRRFDFYGFSDAVMGEYSVIRPLRLSAY